MLKTAADQTELEWLKMKMQAADERPVYKTGEVAAPGTFECRKCGERIHLHAPGHIPPCPKCAHTEYKRISYD
jgi:Zn finger protein HypA/HybF involved in hydrogenase expression